jgi:putative PEP-CTERM system integral membrane protein
MNKQWKTFILEQGPRGLAYGLFWSWNTIFLAFMFLGFGPIILPEVLTGVRTGMIPAQYLAYGILLTAIPAAALVLGLTLLRHSPERLFALGYGVEGPLMLMLAFRFFVVRDATPAVTLLLSIGVMGIATLLWELLDQGIDRRRPWLTHLRAVGLTLLLAIGLYVGVWIAFYAVPLIVQSWRLVYELVRSIWSGLANMQWYLILFTIVGSILLLYTGTLFVGTPIAVPILYLRAWRRGLRRLAAGFGWPRAAALTAVVLIVCAALFVQTNQQPQRKAFALLETPPASLSQAESLLKQQEAIRAGLLNAYLAPLRYISAMGEVRHVSDLYKWSLNLTQEQALRVERMYEVVARPVLYEPVKPRYDELYQTFFDRKIVDGERATIVRAVRSTWSSGEAQTAWQAVDDRAIRLTHQEITVVERGDWAEVELYEAYQNQTTQRQEVVYYFSLPESAVITGLWLGNTPDRTTRFAYQVAPRGAAQAVYRNELRRNMDPALVEQIGPRQYRLRVFPVEPQSWQYDATWNRSVIVNGPPLYMWLTWRVLAQDNAWPMPRLAEKRNVYWDAATTRLVNGAPLSAKASEWLPASVPATTPVKAVAHRVDLPSGETVLIRPMSPGDQPKLPGDLRLAVVLDRSRSMVEHAADAKTALARLSKATNAATVDVYLTASKYRGESPSRVRLAELKPDDIVYYGGQNAAELLAQFDSLRSGQAYDAIFVLTDDSGYELGGGDIQAQAPDAPVWMVHLGGKFPLGYDDATLQAIQASGGGVVGSVDEALTRLAAALEASRDDSLTTMDIIDGYEWLTAPTSAVAATADPTIITHAPDDGFAAFAARRIILAAMQRQRETLGQVGTLDHLHAIAVEHSIVTPYSSMLVLVNQRQEDLLKQLSEQGDRFQREAEQVGETVPASPFAATGVPEPEEWLLIVVAAAMLLWYARSLQRGPRSAR